VVDRLACPRASLTNHRSVVPSIRLPAACCRPWSFTGRSPAAAHARPYRRRRIDPPARACRTSQFLRRTCERADRCSALRAWGSAPGDVYLAKSSKAESFGVSTTAVTNRPCGWLLGHDFHSPSANLPGTYRSRRSSSRPRRRSSSVASRRAEPACVLPRARVWARGDHPLLGLGRLVVVALSRA
jgi:hypothetical protein